FPSVLRFRLYQTVSRSDFLGAFQVPAFLAVSFPAVPTLSEVSGRFDRPFTFRLIGMASMESAIREAA
ncbi:hypothetical protein, partial [Streptomyces sp. NPDC058291]|uniref:hypothetical protein n=1 Tax=Streptomyces sp. NPDC058291 TaxID=3346427 RepID=UPI0036E7F46D